MGFQRGRFCCETSGYVVSCLHLWAPTWTKNPIGLREKENIFFPQRLAGLIFGGIFGWGGGVGWPVLRVVVRFRVFRNIFWSPHFLVVWSGDDSWPEAAQCRGPRWCRVFPGCVTWEFLRAPCIPPLPQLPRFPPRSLAGLIKRVKKNHHRLINGFITPPTP